MKKGRIQRIVLVTGLMALCGAACFLAGKKLARAGQEGGNAETTTGNNQDVEGMETAAAGNQNPVGPGATGDSQNPEVPETVGDSQDPEIVEITAGSSQNPEALEAAAGNSQDVEAAESSDDSMRESMAAEPPLDTLEFGGNPADKDFYAVKLPDQIFERMQGKSYKKDCPIPRKDLRYLHILHKTLDGGTAEGELVCHKIIADDLLEIFKELYDKNYPIERMKLVDDYDADDEASMTDNNSSCFNYRTISNSSKISKHGLGIAVDINPLYNPYTKKVKGKRTVEPAAGEPYLDRDGDFPYKIDEDDLCYQLFTDHGFSWGGAWNSCKDYQHFELDGDKADKLQEKYK